MKKAIRKIQIENLKNNGVYTIMKVEDFEYRNPLKHYELIIITHYISIYSDILRIKGNLKDSDLPILHRMANKQWLVKKDEILNTNIPDALSRLLSINTKKEQEKCLKNLTITSDELIAFIAFAGEEHGYAFSQYSTEYYPNGSNEKEIPKVAYINDDGTIESVGNTLLSDGQLKQIIEHRSVIVAKFLDRSNSWHCFFLTYKSLAGKEVGGKPHLHYISDKWGLTRDYVLLQLKSKKYSLPPMPHINFDRVT